MYDVSVQNFNVKRMFDNIRLINRGTTVPGETDPDFFNRDPYPNLGVGVYELSAYTQGSNPESQTELPYVFLPFIDFECLSNKTGMSLGPSNFTVEFLNANFGVNNMANGYAVEECIRDDVTCG